MNALLAVADLLPAGSMAATRIVKRVLRAGRLPKLIAEKIVPKLLPETDVILVDVTV